MTAARPLHAARMLQAWGDSPRDVEAFLSRCAEIADVVMTEDVRVLVPGLGCLYLKRRESSVVGGKRIGPRESLALAPVKATRRVAE